MSQQWRVILRCAWEPKGSVDLGGAWGVGCVFESVQCNMQTTRLSLVTVAKGIDDYNYDNTIYVM